MRPVVKRRHLTDPAQLPALVIDHVDSIEPGLAMLDSRLLLGQATIDIVGLDAQGALVLMAVAAVADEEMLLRAVEAYSWCLEYPDAIRRLYPSAHISASQPPRLIFVIERMPDSFHRKIKQLGFPEVDCVEFRALDVDGTPAVYFDTLARLRRGPAAAVPAPVSAPAPEHAVPPAVPATTGRPTSVKLQKLLGGDRVAAGRERAQVVSLVPRSTPRPEPPKAFFSGPASRLEMRASPRVVDEPVAAVPEPETLAIPLAVSDAEAVPEPVAPADPVDELEVPEDLPVLDDAGADPFTEPEAEALTSPVTAEPEPTLAPIALDEPELTPIALDERELTPAPMTRDEPELTLVSTDAPESPVPVTPEAEIESSPTLTTSEEPIAALPEPVGVEGAEPKVPEIVPPKSPAAPSVFARRALEPVAPPAEPKLSFAHMAKELLSVTNPTAREETPVASQRPSVEELTRATLDDLVGSGEKPAVAIEEKSATVSAFAKPATAKRPRTIAPPPPDPQPIAAGPTLGAAPKRITPPAPPAATPDPSPTAEPEGAQAAPTQSFEGLQFPNDGVLTRQWMEFLNQMAAGK